MSGARTELRTFRSLGTLRVLNVIAVGASLAGGTGAVLAAMGGMSNGDIFALASALSTLLFGMAWAALLRVRRRVGTSSLRWGWLASIPLAIANAATACGMLMVSEGGSILTKFLTGAVLGATFGAIIWIPGLIATLVAFGLPILWAERRAAKGLAGEEQGEIAIGVVSSVIAIGALLLLAGALTLHPTFGAGIIALFAVAGLVTGALASIFAVHRESVRRNFVREVEAGSVQGFRVDPTPEGKVLIRVTSMGSGYRVANFEEHLAVLDEDGETRRGQV